MNKNGLSILEFLIYLTCSILLFSLAGYATVRVREAQQKRAQLLERWIQLALAMDKVIDDLSQAPSSLTSWKKMAQDEFIFVVGQCERKVTLRNKRLIRCDGHCNQTKKGMSIVLDGVSQVIFDYYVQGNALLGIRCVITLDDSQDLSLESYAVCEASDVGS